MHPEDKKQPHGKQQTLKLQLSANLCTPREAAAPTLTTEQRAAQTKRHGKLTRCCRISAWIKSSCPSSLSESL
jgi:hypothetical protein